jgi:hypothetical protein
MAITSQTGPVRTDAHRRSPGPQLPSMRGDATTLRPHPPSVQVSGMTLDA